MADATHCDREGCDTWSRHPENHGFLTVNWVGSSRLARKDFCSAIRRDEATDRGDRQ